MEPARTPPNLDTEENLRLLIDSGRDYALFMLDPQGRIASWNAGAAALLGYSAAEIRGRKLSDLYPPEDAATGKPDRELQTAAAEGRYEVIEERVRKDGTRFWANIVVTALRDASGQLIGFGKLLRDVTVRVDTERKLRASEERLRIVSDVVLTRLEEGIVILSDSGAIRFANPACEQLFGLKLDTLRGRSFKSLIAPSAHDTLDRFLRDVHRRGVGATEIDERELLALHPEKGALPIALTLGAVGDGRTAMFAGIIRDPGPRRRAEEQIARALKMDVLGRLSGGIAHEFSNLLTIIIGNAESLSGALEARPDLKRQTEMIRTASERGAELSQRLLNFSRRTDAVPGAIDVNQLVTGLRPMVRRALPEDIEVRIDLAAGLGHVTAEPSGLEAALLALILKGYEVAPKARRIVLATRTGTADAASGRQSDAGIITLSVTIDGVGTDAPDLDLALVREFVGADSNRVRQVRQGDTLEVSIALPAAMIATPQTDTPTARSATAPGLVLVAEDDPFVRSYAVACLESLGYRVIAAVDGRDALARLAQGLRPDVLFTDIVMPGGINGWQLAERAVAQLPELKVLYTSGYALETLSERGHLDPAMRVLNKPYRRADLGRHLRELMDEARAG